MSPLIYAVDDEKPFRALLEATLAAEGMRVRTFATGYDLLHAYRHENARPDVLLLDALLPGMDGLALLRTLRAQNEQQPVVMLTGHGTITLAVAAMKDGAADFLTKPIDALRLTLTLRHIMERDTLKNEVSRLTREATGQADFSDIIGTSPAMQALFSQLRRAAASDITVCLHGASGTGKELIARALHGNSPRKDKPFVVVDCGAIAPTLLESTLFGHEKGAFTGATDKRMGKFVEADGGTIFLDEIAELPLTAQTRLLRVLQQREVEPLGGTQARHVNIRLITATHRNLHHMVQDGTFREDLFYRVHVLPVSVPPLEGRRTDIPDLAAFFVRRLCVREGVPLKHLTAEAVRWLVAQPWPGNVRQLENLLHRAVILATGDRIDVADLDPTPAPAPGMDALFTPLAGDALPRLEALQAAYIHHVITRSGGNLTRAARILGIGRTTLYRHKGVNGQKM